MGAPLLTRLRDLYEGDNPLAHRFRYGLLIFDIVTILFVVVSSFFQPTAVTETLDVVFGLVILSTSLRDSPLAAIDFATLHIQRLGLMRSPYCRCWLPSAGEAGGFLRVLRTLRLLHTYQLLARLRTDSAWFRRNEEVAIAVVHLVIFLFVMTGIVFETQRWTNPEIRNYVDALYFTVTALTTTGFGDITLRGTGGRLISVAIMIFGVTLFLRLLRSLLQPHKVRFPCPTCGLQRHDTDAVHCKACGTVLNIPDEGTLV